MNSKPQHKSGQRTFMRVILFLPFQFHQTFSLRCRFFEDKKKLGTEEDEVFVSLTKDEQFLRQF